MVFIKMKIVENILIVVNVLLMVYYVYMCMRTEGFHDDDTLTEPNNHYDDEQSSQNVGISLA